jgi:hypothetical protein
MTASRLRPRALRILSVHRRRGDRPRRESCVADPQPRARALIPRARAGAARRRTATRARNIIYCRNVMRCARTDGHTVSTRARRHDAHRIFTTVITTLRSHTAEIRMRGPRGHPCGRLGENCPYCPTRRDSRENLPEVTLKFCGQQTLGRSLTKRSLRTRVQCSPAACGPDWAQGQVAPAQGVSHLA